MLEEIISNMKTRAVTCAISAIGLLGYAGCGGNMPATEIPKVALESKGLTCCEVLSCSDNEYNRCEQWTVERDGKEYVSCDCYKVVASSGGSSISSGSDHGGEHESTPSNYRVYARYCPPHREGSSVTRADHARGYGPGGARSGHGGSHTRSGSSSGSVGSHGHSHGHGHGHVSSKETGGKGDKGGRGGKK